jgi:hypothetical protein
MFFLAAIFHAFLLALVICVIVMDILVGAGFPTNFLMSLVMLCSVAFVFALKRQTLASIF